MIPQNNTNENTLPEINIQFINAIRELKISTLLKQSNICKTSRSRNGDGGKKRTAFEIFQFLLMLVFEGTNLFRFLGSKKQEIACAKSTYSVFSPTAITTGGGLCCCFPGRPLHMILADHILPEPCPNTSLSVFGHYVQSYISAFRRSLYR